MRGSRYLTMCGRRSGGMIMWLSCKSEKSKKFKNYSHTYLGFIHLASSFLSLTLVHLSYSPLCCSQ